MALEATVNGCFASVTERGGWCGGAPTNERRIARRRIVVNADRQARCRIVRRHSRTLNGHGHHRHLLSVRAAETADLRASSGESSFNWESVEVFGLNSWLGRADDGSTTGGTEMPDGAGAHTVC